MGVFRLLFLTAQLPHQATTYNNANANSNGAGSVGVNSPRCNDRKNTLNYTSGDCPMSTLKVDTIQGKTTASNVIMPSRSCITS